MKKIHGYLAFCFACLLLTACQQREGAQYIPKDALGVFSLNGRSMSQKVAWSALADSRIFDGLTQENKGFDIAATGLDPDANYFAYSLPDARLSGNFKFLSVLPVKDEKKFSDYLKATFPEATFEEKGKIKFAIIGVNKCIGWSGKNAISVFTSFFKSAAENDENTSVRDILEEEIQKSFALPKEQSITSNKQYMELLHEGHDLSFWLNLEAFSKAMPADNYNTANAVLASQKKLLRATYVNGGIDFKKGKIEATAKFYHNPSGTAVAKAFIPKKYSTALIEKIPGDQLNMMMHLQVDPEGMIAFVDTIGMMPITQLYLKEHQLSPDSIFQLFSGDILFTIVDFNLRRFFQNFSSVLSGEDPVPYLQAAVTFTIKKEETFWKMIRIGEEQALITDLGNGIFRFRDYYFSEKDGYVVASPFMGTVKKLLDSSHINRHWKLPESVEGHPFSFYLNVKGTTDSLSAAMEDNNRLKKALNLIDNIQLYGGEITDNHSTFHAVMYFQNREQNSLAQLIGLENPDNAAATSK